MRKIWVVVRREFVERVRSKWFIISTVLGPILMAAVIFLPMLLAERGGRHRSIAVMDVTSTEFGARVTDMLNGSPPVDAIRLEVEVADLEAVADSLARVVGEKTLDGFLILTDATIEDGQAEYRGSNVSALIDMRTLQSLLRRAVVVERLDRVGVDPQLVAQAQITVEMHTIAIRGGQATEGSAEGAFMLAYIVWFVLYVAILLYGVQVMGSVVEEKTSRVIEVLISSLRPFQLLAGKVLGVGSVGLFQLLIWGIAARLLVSQRGLLLSILGLDGGAGQVFRLPEVSTATIVIFLTYFVLGYFLYAAMFAAVGAMSSTEADARQAQTPVVMLLVIPSVLMLAILQQPDGSIAVALSLIPFCSPIAMPVRWAAAEVPLGELVLSIAFLIGALVMITWIAARIYRIGILMYGKRPSPRELIRWVRAA